MISLIDRSVVAAVHCACSRDTPSPAGMTGGHCCLWGFPRGWGTGEAGDVQGRAGIPSLSPLLEHCALLQLSGEMLSQAGCGCSVLQGKDNKWICQNSCCRFCTAHLQGIAWFETHESSFLCLCPKILLISYVLKIKVQKLGAVLFCLGLTQPGSPWALTGQAFVVSGNIFKINFSIPPPWGKKKENEEKE